MGIGLAILRGADVAELKAMLKDCWVPFEATFKGSISLEGFLHGFLLRVPFKCAVLLRGLLAFVGFGVYES